MTLKQCITNAANDGEITPEQATEAMDLFTELETQYQGRMSPGQAAAQAGRDTFDALQNLVLHRKRQKILAYQNWKQITKNLDEYRNFRGEADHNKAALALLARDENAKFSAFENRVQAVTNSATRNLYNVLATFRKNLVGSTRKKAKLHNMVREIFGESTGDASASEFAQAWAKTAEYLRQRFNAAGGRIPKRADWGMPQFHDSLRVRKVSYDEWRDFILPRLDAAKMIVHKDNDKQVKIIAGKFEKAEGPVKGHNVEPIYFDVELNKDKEFSFNLPSTHNSFIYLISGEIYIGEKKHNKLIDSTLILLDKGEILKVRARSNSKFLLISGKPIKEQIARGGPFVMNTKEEISQAVEDYHAGRFVK